ncbi:MAG: glycosyltransferase [Ilumatobacteraceae bacterium]
MSDAQQTPVGHGDAPPVVVAMVVHEPGPWIGEVLDALATQDYPNVRHLFLVTASTATGLHDVLRGKFPLATVRTVEGNPGFAPMINQVPALVEGDGGFFCIVHDDVAPAPDAIRRLVEEAFRSNAAVVGPKLVEWGDPGVLQHVGLLVDRVGEVVDVVDPGERDQEQHDAVRDVFAVPSAFLLVRNDLFRELGGMSPSIAFFGEDVEFCWRVHLAGARVIVNPASVVRHRGGFVERAQIANHESRAARHRLRTVLTLTHSSRLPRSLVSFVVVSLVELVVGALSGSSRVPIAALRALPAVAVEVPAIRARRRAIAPMRRVGAREIAALQVRGSARVAGWWRHRRALREASTSEHPAVSDVAAARTESQRNSRSAGIAIVAGIVVWLVAVRDVALDGVATVGRIVPLVAPGESWRDVFRLAWDGWSPVGFGDAGTTPSWFTAVAVGAFAVLGRIHAIPTLIVVAALPIGVIGMWRLAGVVDSLRGRTFGALAYVALPVASASIAAGRIEALVVWMLLPWFVDFARRWSGATDEDDAAQGPRRTQLLGSIALVGAVATMLAPSFVVVAVIVAVGALLAWPFVGGAARRTTYPLAAFGVAAVGSFALHFPWSRRFVALDAWQFFVGTPSVPESQDFRDILALGATSSLWWWFVVAVYVAVPLVVLTASRRVGEWVVRAGFGAAIALGVASAAQAGVLPVAAPEPLVLAAPVALALALVVAAAVQGLEGVRRRAFGIGNVAAWCAAVACAPLVVPALVTAADGRFDQPRTTLASLLAQLPQDPPEGDHHVVYIGDPRVLPLASRRLTDHLSFGVVADGPVTVAAQWLPRRGLMDEALERDLRALINGASLRVGRLLAPLAVRYVAVPLRDGITPPNATSAIAAARVVDALSAQLDFRRVYTSTDVVIFENSVALAKASVLDEKSSIASAQAGDELLLAADLVAARVPFVGIRAGARNVGESSPGTLHLAAPYSDRWTLDVDGAAIAPRVAFGMTTAFDAPLAGTATLTYDTPLLHRAAVLVQIALWIAVLVACFNPSRFRGRVRAARVIPVVSMQGDADDRVVL